MAVVKRNYPNYVEDLESCKSFLKDFREGRSKKYWKQMKAVAARESKLIEVELEDLQKFGKVELAKRIQENARRYAEIFSRAIDSKEMPQVDLKKASTVQDVILHARLIQHERLDKNEPYQAENEGQIPAELKRQYQVVFKPLNTTKTTCIREIEANSIGGLIQVRGIVTRITEVRPMCKVATYLCDTCGCQIYQIINGRNYTPEVMCQSQQCVANKNKRPIFVVNSASKFVKFQEMKLQELPEHVPVGATPRSISVYCFEETTRIVTCGDKVTVTGIWLPIPVTGFRNMRAGLTANTYLEALSIEKDKQDYRVEGQDEEIMKAVDDTLGDRDIYQKLARSIAPEIYGMENVKKALLLLMIAGVTKDHGDGLRIRGDINVLLMGDPGVAKSQLLKGVMRIAPRVMYTTGKGSSGVGLTAAVLRDPSTNDMILEGGALVLADKGICCIDEFDKMEESDRTAIHEVMEQQTVSIAKAGITTTLNARTAILAAANPAFGRYNKKRTPEENIALPAALLSRFDLLFVLVDKPDHDNDIALARHITHVHQHSTHPPLDFEPFSSDFLRAYIAKARTFEPTISPDESEFLIGAYVSMRQKCLGDDGMYDSKKIVMTPRGLLSILRLSQALARLQFKEYVSRENIEEAIRLMDESRKSMKSDGDKQQDKRDTVSKIYDMIINHMMGRQKDEVTLAKLEEILTVRGFTTEQINETITRYDNINVWTVSRDKTMLRLVD